MDQVEEVRNKTDIVELIGKQVALKKSGRSLKGLCPFHSETQPSFFVSPELQIYKCFGCGAGGNVFNFLMATEGMTFGEALRFLADKAGIKLQRYQPTGEEKQRDLLLEINHLSSEYYHYLLITHPVGQPARDYLKKRKITGSSIKLFKLGYAPGMWDGLIKFLVDKKKYRIQDLEKAGLVLKKTRYYDRFRERIIFPLFDHRANVCGFSGRVIVDQDDSPKYINTPETPLYHKSNFLYGLETTKNFIKKENLAILFEGETDVISSYQAGVKNVAAIKGSALTQEQVRLLGRFCENIALAFDVDLAGDAAAKRGIEIAESEGLNIRMIKPLAGKDADECIRNSAQLWRDSVKKSMPVWDFYLESAFQKYGSGTAESKKKVGQAVIPFFARISNEIVKAHYVKVLARRLAVDEEAVVKEMEKTAKQAVLGQRSPLRRPAAEAKISAVPKTRREILEEYLLALILQKQSMSKITVRIQAPVLKKIWQRLEEKKTKFSMENFYRRLPSELREAASQLYLQDLGKVDFQLEIKKTIQEVAKIDLREKLKALAKKGNLERFNRLAKKLKALEVK